MEASKTKVKTNDELLPELTDLQRAIAVCIQTARTKQEHMHERFGTHELAMTIAQLQEASLWCGQVVYRLGYKPRP